MRYEICNFSSNITCGICCINGRLSASCKKERTVIGSWRDPHRTAASPPPLRKGLRKQGFSMEDVPSADRYGKMVVVLGAMWLRNGH